MVYCVIVAECDTFVCLLRLSLREYRAAVIIFAVKLKTHENVAALLTCDSSIWTVNTE